MNGIIKRNAIKGRALARAIAVKAGFSTLELMATVGMITVVIGLAIPSYKDAVEKRQITQGAELIVAFVNTIQSESIKRNRMVAVSYSTDPDGSWCLGAVLGQSPCDCTQTDPAEPAYCGLEGAPWMLRDTDVQAKNLIQSVSGDGAYIFDPVRGLFTDSTDVLSLGLGDADGQYQINLDVIATGKVSVCLPELSEGIHGLQRCPQGL